MGTVESNLKYTFHMQNGSMCFLTHMKPFNFENAIAIESEASDSDV